MLFRCSETPRMVSSLNPARVCVLSSLARTFRSCLCSCSTSHTGVHRDGPPFAYGCHCVLLLNSVSCRCSETPGMKRRLFCCVIVFCIFISFERRLLLALRVRVLHLHLGESAYSVCSSCSRWTVRPTYCGVVHVFDRCWNLEVVR